MPVTTCAHVEGSPKGERPRETAPPRLRFALAWAFLGGPVVWLLLHLPAGGWFTILGYHAGCWIAARAVPAPFGARPTRRALGLAAAATAVLVLGTGLVACTLWPELQTRPLSTWRGWGLRAPFDVPFLLYYAAVNPLLEERYWRAALLGPSVRARLGSRAALGLSIAGFLPHHAVVLASSYGTALGLLLVLPVLAAALVWTAWRERSGGVWLPLASHAGADVGLALLYIVLLRF